MSVIRSILAFVVLDWYVYRPGGVRKTRQEKCFIQTFPLAKRLKYLKSTLDKTKL